MGLEPKLINKRYVDISPCCLVRGTRICKILPEVVSSTQQLGSNVNSCITGRMVGLVGGGKMLIGSSGVLLLNVAFGRGYPSVHGAGIISVCSALLRCAGGVSICSP